MQPLDVVLAVWAAVWIWAGITVGQEVRDLGRLSQTVGEVGQAVTRSGDAIGEVAGALPLVGDRIGEAAGAIREAGEQATVSARRTEDSARRLKWLLGIAVGLVPTFPVLVLYLPRRIAQERDRRELQRMIEAGMTDGLAELLARRATLFLPFERLRRISDDPGADIAAGRWDGLASAELRRLGLRPPPRR